MRPHTRLSKVPWTRAGVRVRSATPVALSRLIAKWRKYAEDSARELGSTIDAVGRAELEQMELTYKVCARELERALKQTNY